LSVFNFCQGQADTPALLDEGGCVPAISAKAPVGRRESNKNDKLRRITDAARALFVANGYDDTTTREIAVRANVAIGTVFTYAANKRDLLFLVVNDELDDIATKAEAIPRPDRPLLENLLAAFGQLYGFFSRQPQLARMTLREMLFYESSTQAIRFLAIRQRIILLAGEIVRIAQRRGEVRRGEDADFVGWVIFSIFQVELRRWIAAKDRDLIIGEGLSALERAWSLLVAGLAPRAPS
jgi:AcrR family transcriptional regulator